jgi:hypothetical protein
LLVPGAPFRAFYQVPVAADAGDLLVAQADQAHHRRAPAALSWQRRGDTYGG